MRLRPPLFAGLASSFLFLVSAWAAEVPGTNTIGVPAAPAAAPVSSTNPAVPKKLYGWNLTLDRIPKDLKVEDNIVYRTIGGQALKMIVFYPKIKKYERAPLLVYIHGGGWAGGNRYVVITSGGIDVVRQLNAAGVVCASIEYRLLPLGTEHPPAAGASARLDTMDQEADCRDAIHFLVENAARFGIDPARIATMGGSAGGHLSLVTALGRDQDYPCDPTLAKFGDYKILAEAADFPLVSLLDPAVLKDSVFTRGSHVETLAGGALPAHEDAAEKLSPELLLKRSSPPILLVHGERDRTLNVQNSIALAALCRQKGVPVELIVVKNADHGFRPVSAAAVIDPSPGEINQRTAAFLLKYLLPGAK